MPELPEVETVRRGLAPAMEGAIFEKVQLERPDLRFPLPENFAKRLLGATAGALGRRGKYLTVPLSTGETLVLHLGMTGKFIVARMDAPAASTPKSLPSVARHAHNHVNFILFGTRGRFHIGYHDARRFGFMDLVPSEHIERSRHFAGMGPEPLGRDFGVGDLSRVLAGRSAPIKAALLDQAVVAGLGNIYVSEALFRAKISPRREARRVSQRKVELLHDAIINVLAEAIEAGGSSLRDFAASDGALGYFQHQFRVYDREGEPCPECGEKVRRIVQSGRSSFYCGTCQR